MSPRPIPPAPRLPGTSWCAWHGRRRAARARCSTAWTGRGGAGPESVREGRRGARVPARGTMEPDYLRLKRVELVDPHGFERPIPALSLLIPSDWTFAGQVVWPLDAAGP